MVVDSLAPHKPKNCESGWYTVRVPASRSDAKILLVATGSVILAGLLVAAVLLLATSRSNSPTKYVPFPAGVARSKLWALLAGKQLGVTATARNWITVTKLRELLDG